MPQGTIKKIIADKGFGFIGNENKDVFFHRSAVEGGAFEDLREGDTVDYTDPPATWRQPVPPLQ